MPNFNIPDAIELAQARGSSIERAQAQGMGLEPEQTESMGLIDPQEAATEEAQIDPAQPSKEKLGLGDYAVDAAMMAPRAAEGLAESVYGLADWITGDRLWDWDRKEHNLLGRSKTIPGMLGEGVLQFLAGFIPGIGWAGKLGKATKLGKVGDKSVDLISKGVIHRAHQGKRTLKLSTMRKLKRAKPKVRKAAQFVAAGAMADFVAFKGEQARLSNLLIGHKGEDASAILNYLAYDPTANNNEIEERFKNVIEGFFVGGVLSGLFVGGRAGVRGIKKARADRLLRAEKGGARPGKQELATDDPHANRLDEMEDEWWSRQPEDKHGRPQDPLKGLDEGLERVRKAQESLDETAQAAASGAIKTLKVFRDTGENLYKQSSKGETLDEVDEYLAFAKAADDNKLTPTEKKALRTVESATKDAQHKKAYEAATKKQVSEETRPVLVPQTKSTDAVGGRTFPKEWRQEYDRRVARLGSGEMGGVKFGKDELLSFEDWVALGKGSLRKERFGKAGKAQRAKIEEAKKASAKAEKEALAATRAKEAKEIDESLGREEGRLKDDELDEYGWPENAEMQGRGELNEAQFSDSDSGRYAEAAEAKLEKDVVQPAIAEKKRILALPNTVTRPGWRKDFEPQTQAESLYGGAFDAGSQKIARPFFASKDDALKELKLQGKNADDYTIKRVGANKELGIKEEEWAVIRKSDEAPELRAGPEGLMPVRKADGGAYSSPARAEAALKRKGKNPEEYTIRETEDGGYEAISLRDIDDALESSGSANVAPPAKPPEFSPIDVAKATEDELDAWIVKNLGTSWRAVDEATKRKHVKDVLEKSDSEEFMLRQAEEYAEQKIRDAGMFEGGPQAAYSAVRLVQSVPELRAMVARVARMGAKKAAEGKGAALSRAGVKALEKEAEGYISMGIEVAGGDKTKALGDLDAFRGRVEDLKTVRNEAETLYGFLMEASGDIRVKVSNAIEARDNGSVMVTSIDGTVKSMGPEEALTDLFSSVDRYLAVQELWADFGTQLSLGLRQRQDFYRTGQSSLGRDIPNQNRRLGMEALDEEGGLAGKMAQKLYRNGVRNSMRESKFLRKMEMMTKHEVGVTPKAMDDSLRMSENHAMANRLSNFLPSGRKLLASTQEWFINALLGSPTTWGVNIIGNGLVMALRHFEMSAGAVLTGNMQLLKAHTRALFDVHSFMDSLKYALKAGWDDEAKSVVGHTAYSDNRIAAKGEIYSPKGVGPDANIFYTAINWLGKAVRHPTRILMTGDEFFKQMNFRAHTKTMLAMEGYEKGLHKTPKALAQFVDDGFEGLITHTGRFRNEANVLKDAKASLARKMEAGDIVPGRGESEHLAKYVDDHYRSHELTLSDGTIYNAKDLGQRNKLVEGGTDWALINTFTNNPTNKLVKTLNGVATFSPWLTFIVPFVRTPSNIITFALGRVLPTTPMSKLGKSAFDKAKGRAGGVSEKELALAQREAEKGFLKGREYDVEMPSADAMIAEKMELLSRAGSFEAAEYTGRLAFSGLAVGSIFMSVEGIKDRITGAAPNDKAKRNVWEADGKRPYSIKLDLGEGEKWYSYQRLDPFATILGIHADLVHGFADSRDGKGSAFGNEEELEEKRPFLNRTVGVVGMTFANNITNKSYVEGLGSLLDLLRKPDHTFTQVAGGVLAGFVPNGMNVSQNVFQEDAPILEARKLLDGLMKKLPEGVRPKIKEDNWAMSKKLMPKRNFLGEIKRKEGTGTLESAFNPFFHQEASNDIVDLEFASQGVGKGDMTPTLSVRGQELNMREYRNDSGQTAYDRVQELASETEIRGMKLRGALRFIIESANYQGLMEVTEENSGPGHPRTKILSKVINRYRAAARKQLFSEFPELKEDYRALLTQNRN